MQTYNRLSQYEREQLFLLRHEGKSFREIGVILGRTHTTLSREYRRLGTAAYTPITAHDQARTLRGKSRRKKLDDLLLQTYVIKKLSIGWSPEIIAGRLRRKGSSVTVCHETIYTALYTQPLKKEKLWEFLRRGHKKRVRWRDRRVHTGKRVIIPERVSIGERPQEAQIRSCGGHWETDLMEGSRKTHHVVSVTVDRKSRAVILDKLMSKESEEKIGTMISRMRHIPIHVRKTMTFDNGTEDAGHRRLHGLRMSTYFCKPYHSWEKGTVENTIGCIRQFYPKGGDLTHVTQQELRLVSQILNDRPKKCLGYKTPNEVLLEEAGWCVTS